MRQITITGPRNSASQVAQIAFAVGISQVSVSEKRILDTNGSEAIKDSIEMDVGTPSAKAFIDEFTSAPFFSRDKFSIAVRQPRSLVSSEELSRLAPPFWNHRSISSKSFGNFPKSLMALSDEF